MLVIGAAIALKQQFHWGFRGKTDQEGDGRDVGIPRAHAPVAIEIRIR
jgi:hypothetical protein